MSDPKEGMDKPGMITNDADFVSTPSPQLCVQNEEEGASCGSHLGVKGGPKGHITGYVVSGGAAERGGLREGDRLLEVNNCYVDDVPHSELGLSPRLFCEDDADRRKKKKSTPAPDVDKRTTERSTACVEIVTNCCCGCLDCGLVLLDCLCSCFE